MTTKDRLIDALSGAFSEKEKRRVLIPAKIGTVINGSRVIDVPRRPGFVYVRLRGNYSEQIEAYNDSVNTIFDLPVLVERDRFAQSIYRVVGRDVGLYSAGGWPGGAGLAPHGDQHSFGYSTGSGSDVVWVYKRQFMPLLVHPHPDPEMNLWIQAEEDWYSWGRDYIHFTGTTMSVAGAVPAAGLSRFMHFYVDGDATLKAQTGTTFTTFPYPDNQTLLGYIPELTMNEGISLCAMILHYSTTQLAWSQFYDTRPMLNGGIVQPGNSFVLIDVSEGLLTEYPPTGPGFQSAIDASDTYDTILYPITIVTGTYRMKPNTNLIGQSEFGSILIGSLLMSDGSIDRLTINTYTTGIASPLTNTSYPSIYIYTGTVFATNLVIRNTSQLMNATPAGFGLYGTGSVFIRNSYMQSHTVEASDPAHIIFNQAGSAYQIEAHYNTFAEYGDVEEPISALWKIVNTGTFNSYANSWPYDYQNYLGIQFRKGDRDSIFTTSIITTNTALENQNQKVAVDASGGSVTVTLPEIQGSTTITVLKVDSTAYQVIIDGYGSETINGDTTLVLEFENDAATLAAFETGWRIV